MVHSKIVTEKDKKKVLRERLVLRVKNMTAIKSVF